MVTDGSQRLGLEGRLERLLVHSIVVAITAGSTLWLSSGRLFANAAQVDAVPCFTDAGAGLTGVEDSFAAWGDYDNDGDLDILLGGREAVAGSVTKVCRSSGGANPTFADIGAGLPGVLGGTAAWGDYDRDGDLDILLTGNVNALLISRVYRNSGGANPTFTDIGAGLPGVSNGSVAWGDYDNDGDLDIVLTGATAVTPISMIYRNSGGANPTFTDIGAGLPGVSNGSVAWGDYDNDGDLDILLSGTGTSGTVFDIYRNNGGVNPTFSATSTFGGGPGETKSCVAWGDFDADNDLDLVVTSGSGSQAGAVVDKNMGGAPPIFFDLTLASGVANGTVAWGDYDNDGDLDLLLTGFDGSVPSAKVLQNDGAEIPTFTDVGAGLPGVGLLGSRTASAWGDYDNDGDLDVLITGLAGGPTRLAAVYRNNCGPLNTPPQAPTNLAVSLNGTRATFSWTAATDAQTPSAGLSYNLRVGTLPGAMDIVGPMAGANGFRRVVGLGNTNEKTSWEIQLPAAGHYYWSVQAVDGAFAGSLFADGTTTATGEDPVPRADGLHSTGPNPFSNSTSLEFDHAGAGSVSLAVYDLAGHRLRTLCDGQLRPGRFTRSWDGRDDTGRQVPSGIYYVRLKMGTVSKSAKITLLR